ncbi:immunoglobulin-like domain-containing protein [Oceanirhabdus seepicola]|uniref:DUF5011 domain-containing protein n=1 Tax=Oceanirhabdus seepicola TaxID=2828781 RepID=A0A9J6P1S3_9CLOT|nr:immunoglobulin-like domain-containing protein [Oceanirhabdus seepicola]MCM1990483.1 DUF5011 domain-containing protein [Oceanirhabdus seepicola]
MNYRKVACIALSLLIGSSVTSYADIPKGTVVIDNKAYDLHYINQEVNLKNIYKQYVNAVSDIYVKSNNGKWYNNSTGKEISKEFIPQVTYIDESGKVSDYSQEDGVEIELAAENVSFINANQVKIQFNKKMMEESVLNKSNYKIGEKDLSENDIVEFKEDGKTVIITLENSLEGKIIDTSIFISEKILDINNNPLNNNFTRNILVINDGEAQLDKEIHEDINIIVNNFNLNNININGDIYINADNVKVNKIISSGKIIINEGENRKTELSNSEFKKINVLSNGQESIILNSIKADTLYLNSNEAGRITAKGSTKISKTIVQSSATLDLISGSLGKVTINIHKDKGSQSLVEFKGKFKDSIIMESGARLNFLQGAECKKLDVRPFFRDSVITVEGTVKNIEVNRECILNILKKANITNEILVNCKSKINGEKGSKVNKLNISPNNNIDKINIAGEFKHIEITEDANIEFIENTVIHKLVAYKNVILNGYKTVKIKEIQADKEVDIKKEDNARNKGFNLPNIKPIQKNSSSTSTNSGGSSSSSNSGGSSSNNSGGGGNSGTVSNSKPEANSVTISGEVKVGQRITGNYQFYDKNSDNEGNSIFKWYRADDMNGTNKSKISNESGKTYILTNRDVGKYISFEVTPVATSGEKTGTAVMSNFIGPVEEVVVADTEKPVITLKGSKTINLEVGDVYEEAGATAVDNIDGNITDNIVRTITNQQGNQVDKVDTTKAGEYTISYNVSDVASNQANEVTRTVIVKEKEVPQQVSVDIQVDGYKVIITVEGENLSHFVELKIINKETGELEFADTRTSENNSVVFTKTIEKVGEFTADIKPFDKGDIIQKDFRIQGEAPDPDTEKPKISLNGKKEIELEFGDIYNEPGATAVDNKDRDITENIVVTITNQQGNEVDIVDTTSAGEFTIHYNVTDQAGNVANEVTRTVIVNEKEVPEHVGVGIEVFRYNVAITVVGENLSNSVEITIINKETGEVVLADTRTPENDRVVFTERIDKVGKYIVDIKPFDNEYTIQGEFTIQGENQGVVDIRRPIITMNGSEVVELEVGDPYVDAGATAEDDRDGDVTDNIIVTIKDQQGNEVNAVDTSSPGEFRIHYNVFDQSRNPAEEVTRTVIVNEKEVPQEDPVTIEVDGYNVKITIEGESLKHSASLIIINKETGVKEDIQEKVPVGNKVVFERRIQKKGEFTAIIKAFTNGDIIEKDFSINE